MSSSVPSTREVLMLEFAERKRRNESYSMRAYARDLDVSVGLISEIFSGKRMLTPKIGNKILPHLHLPPYQQKIFMKDLAGIGEERGDAHLLDVEILRDDEFRLISDWYHFAILSLAKTSNCRATATFIGKRIGISSTDAELAMSRLRRLGLLKVDRGRLIRTKKIVETMHDIPSIAVKKSHQQTLEQTIAALYNVPVNQREISSTTVASTPEKMLQAKSKMREFAASMREFLESGDKTEVYNLNLQLVPLTLISQNHL
ncbi:MAG: DUF4423 domain-containing protein [Proteobacteria bacterium]|nr:DUF4423 domain-containing protein [Pseudomonadota bacterium]